MDRKVEELADSIKNEKTNDLRELFGTKNEETIKEDTNWDYCIKEENIVQPPLITSPSNPIILHNNEETYFSFDGRTLFFDLDYKNFYIFLPYSIRSACIYNLKKKTSDNASSFILTLDNQNKLSYNEFKDHKILENRILISRNVLQLVERNKEIYYLSFKKDVHFLNAIVEDGGILKPKIIVHNLISKYNISIFCTLKGVFVYQDRNIISSTGKKLKIKGDGICDLNNQFVIYNKTKNGFLFILCDENFVIKNEMTIENSSHVIKAIGLDKILCCRIGYMIYFIEVIKGELVVRKKIECSDVLLDFSARLDNKNILICKLLQKNIEPKKQEEQNLVTQNVPFDLPPPAMTSKVYSPQINQSYDIEEVILKLYEKFENKLDEIDAKEKKNQYELLDRISENLNNSLITVVEKVVRNELACVQQNIINFMNSKLSNLSKKEVDEERILDFTREIICDTLLPVVEASMDEMRIQVVSEVASFRDSDYLKEVKTALSDLAMSETRMTDIERFIKSNNFEKAVDCVIKGSSKEMDDLIFHLLPSQLEFVSTNVLLGLLDKIILLAKDSYIKEYDDLIYNTLANIELDSLDDSELRSLVVILSQIKENELFCSDDNKQVLVLVNFLKFKISKILFKKQKSLKN
jgi:hypothetical protein